MEVVLGKIKKENIAYCFPSTSTSKYGADDPVFKKIFYSNQLKKLKTSIWNKCPLKSYVN